MTQIIVTLEPGADVESIMEEILNLSGVVDVTIKIEE